MCGLFQPATVVKSEGKIIHPFKNTSEPVLNDSSALNVGQCFHLDGQAYEVVEYLGVNDDGDHGHVVRHIGDYDGSGD